MVAASGQAPSLATSRSSVTASRDLLAVLPWLLIPYDSLTHLLGADASATSQTLPLVALLSLPYLLFRNLGLRASEQGRRIFGTLLATFLIMGALAMIHAALEHGFTTRVDWAVRLPAAARQAISMAMGMGTFLMFHDALLRLGTERCMRLLVTGALPSLLLGTAQFLLGSDRVQGFSSEPSHLADMLVLGLLPACVLAAGKPLMRWTVAGWASLVLLLTFSTTGLIKAVFTLMSFFAVRGQLLRGLGYGAAVLILVYAGLSQFPDNYVFLMLSFMQTVFEQTGELVTASFIDRFFGFIGPVSQLATWQGWLGYGFGADAVYFDQLFSPDTADAIREVKGEVAGISSLQGKMLMYGGVVGYLVYLRAWWLAHLGAPAGHLARVMLPAVFASSLFSLGPLFLPYVWLWLAVAATSATPSRAAVVVATS